MTDAAPARIARAWSVAVRRARPDDRDAVLTFTTDTWDGWDYIAEVWEDWVADTVGAFLVATAEPGPAGEPPVDRSGEAIAQGRIVAITHLRMLSATEAWVEGIRVDPVVRGMDIATDLQTAVLDAARAAGATILRYVTGTRNEGSLHLGARHGLLPVGTWRLHGRGHEGDRTGPEGRAAVEAALASAEADGVLLPPSADADADRWFARIAGDATFQAGHGLYEHRSWAAQSLDAARLAEHIRAGEVLALGPDPAGHWSLLIVNRAHSIEEGELWPALLVGEGGQVVRLLDRLGGATGPLARLRLPDPAPLLDGHASAMDHLGYRPHEGSTVIVEKHLG